MQVPTCWTEAAKPEDGLTILATMFRHHAALSGDLGLKMLYLQSTGDYLGLIKHEIPVSQPGLNPGELFHARQAQAFYKKLESLDVGIDKEQVAWDKFRASERKNAQTNQAFRAIARGTAYMRPRDVLLIEGVRRKIAKVLGRCPKISELDLKFGTGATTSTKKKEACPQNKFAAGLYCSSSLATSCHLPELLRELPHWIDALETKEVCLSHDAQSGDMWLVEQIPVIVAPGVLSFVPKTALTLRPVVPDPSLNGIFQAGIGKIIAKRLRAVGIDVDIRDQTRNSRLAKRGSIDDSIATIDLSEASNLISTQLVKLLVGKEWYELLRSARTPRVEYYPSSEYIYSIELEMFSAMGNGFTFPLETLIFWAITSTACPPNATEDIGIYGDDIICPKSHVDAVVRSLEFCGFIINAEKSFTAGPFRESCGADYYLGFPCRPYYQKLPVSGQTLFTLHNFYMRRGYEDEAAMVRQFLPRSLRIYGPDGYGDGHLLSEQWPRLYEKHLKEKGYCGCSFETYTTIPVKQLNRYPGDWVSPLYHIYRQDSTGLEASDCPFRDDIYTKASVQSVRQAHKNRALWRLRESVSELKFTRELQFINRRPVWTLPGSEGYKAVRIYTFA